MAVLVMFMILPLSMNYCLRTAESSLHWSEARRDSSNQAPDPKILREPVLQAYAARAFGWRGAFGVHTWIASKRANADHFVRYEVIGWGVRSGTDAIRVGPGIPDGYWFGSKPKILIDKRGPEVETMIDQIEAAAQRYPYNDRYALWPGPNSNTFTAFIAREVPDLRLDLPPTAIGKDYLPDGRILAKSPSGTGFQVSFGGLAGVLFALDEGFEINLLGLTLGFHVYPPAIKLPGIGRLGM